MYPYSRKTNKSHKVDPQKYTKEFLRQMDLTYPSRGLHNAIRIATTNINALKSVQPSKIQSAKDLRSTTIFWENVLGLLEKV